VGGSHESKTHLYEVRLLLVLGMHVIREDGEQSFDLVALFLSVVRTVLIHRQEREKERTDFWL
jgi:hypothetical protein